jgi:hypothetical protein
MRAVLFERTPEEFARVEAMNQGEDFAGIS